MFVDKNLFLYDLAIVAIMKNEAPYVKEWIDYHLMAGVNHFFIYDNDSEDDLKDILQPYIDAGLVTYKIFPGEMIQTPAYNAAINDFKFLCRYMAFIDADEFILPKIKPSIGEVLDEIFGYNRSIAGLAINWQYYGSNGQEKADYSRGVLERFTRRAPKNWTHIEKTYSDKIPAGNAICKLILNPRKIKGMLGPHNAIFYPKCLMVNEIGFVLRTGNNFPVTVNKIAVNHYRSKTPEEYLFKINRGNTDTGNKNFYNWDNWNDWDRNEEYDDRILKYRDARKAILIPDGNIENLFNAKQINIVQISDALKKNLLQNYKEILTSEFFKGKLETFLTCRAVANYLKENNLIDKKSGKLFEEAALNAILKTLSGKIQVYELKLFISELPKILAMNYPAVQDILKNFKELLKKISYVYRIRRYFNEYADNEELLRLLETFDHYTHK